uniref:Uncharacterized protein n=1 Tax=Anguilla anguilla TaxID=7936 RepID=A0A0E9TKW3_ANGAN
MMNYVYMEHIGTDFALHLINCLQITLYVTVWCSDLVIWKLGL